MTSVMEIDSAEGHDHSEMTPIESPQSPAEIEAFVAAIRSSPEMHLHDVGSSMAGDHMAALGLVPRSEATHIAVKDGDWDDPTIWHNGEIPGDDAKVLVPQGIHVTYDHVSDARIFTLRVDGELEFSTDTDSQLVVDTIVVSPSGYLKIGTEADPVHSDVTLDIIFANNGPIDTDWDPMLLSRGMLAHGTVSIHGALKDSHEKVTDDPQAGDTWLDFGTLPEGWQVGDTIVVAGTHYEGYPYYDPKAGYSPSEDEVRVISHIEDGRVFFDEPLVFDHDTPRADLKTSVANYTRNVSFETEEAETAEIFERGHVMFMHNDDVDVRYAEFHELGRTDKSEEALNASEFDDIDFAANVKGRYSFHFHRAGMDDMDNPGVAVGNAVFGSPGWGFVHHDSNAILDNNATYDTFGAGYVAESGNETGAWTNNIAIFSQGISWKDPKLEHQDDLDTFDLGRTGDGFWFQGRMVGSSDNIAASVNHGFVYFHRGNMGEKANIRFDAEVSPIADALYYGTNLGPEKHPILGFSGNEAFAARSGLSVVKASPQQGHDIHSVLEDFTAWSVKYGAELQYSGHYTLKNFDLIGKESSALSGDGISGIVLGTNMTDITVVDSTIQDFDVGIDLKKLFTFAAPPGAHDYTVVNPTFINVDNHYANYDPTLDQILGAADLNTGQPDVALDGPLTYRESDFPGDAGSRQITISGTKTDALGTTDFPSEADNYNIGWRDVRGLLEKDGYFATSEGQNYFLLDLYFSDRLTGDIFVETHPVFLDDNITFGPGGHWAYQKVAFNGVQDLETEGDISSDSATLWAILTDGHWNFNPNSDAPESYPKTQDTIDQGGNLLERFVTEADGDTITTHFDQDGMPDTLVFFDGSDTRNWTYETSKFDSNGDLTLESKLYDNDNTSEITFEKGRKVTSFVTEADGDTITTHFDQDGMRDTLVFFDGSDTRNWTYETSKFDSNGDLTLESKLYDNDNTSEITFEKGRKVTSFVTEADDDTITTHFDQDGMRDTLVFFDGSDTRNWTYETSKFDSNGDLTSKSKLYDNGNTSEITFEKGRKVTSFVTEADGDTITTHFDQDGMRDTLVFFNWTYKTSKFDSNGDLTSKSKRYDKNNTSEKTFEKGREVTSFVTEADGDTITTHFDQDGMPDTLVLFDGSDTRNWTYKTSNFDHNGNILEQSIIFDAQNDLMW